MIKRLALLFVVLCSPLLAQNTGFLVGSMQIQASSCAPNAPITGGSCVTLQVRPGQDSTVGVVLQGTWSATVQFETSSDGGYQWVAATATPLPIAAPVASTTANGTWIVPAVGVTHVRTRVSAYTSGVVTASFSPSVGPTSYASSIAGTVNVLQGNVVGTTDPCASSGTLKKHAFANITTATTTSLVAVSGSTTVYLCSVNYNMVATVAADTIYLEQGTGASCAGSPTAITATVSSGILTNGAVNYASATVPGTFVATAASNGLCAVTTVGTGPTIAVDVAYVQQ